jgi:flavin reductase (DIM6/NTAB) family NADH-FMN oxidoreductase RutF
MGGTHFYEPKDGHQLPHDPFKAIVVPRPIGWISTVDTQGRPNLAPYSFLNAFCENPPVAGFSSSGHNDSQSNAEETGEFVVNLATRRQAKVMNRTSGRAAARGQRVRGCRPARRSVAPRAIALEWPTLPQRWSAGSCSCCPSRISTPSQPPTH